MYDIDGSCLAFCFVFVRAFVRGFCCRDRSTTASASASTATPQEKELKETAVQSAMETKETVDDAVQTEAPSTPSGVRGVKTPPLSRTETADSVEIVGDVLA